VALNNLPDVFHRRYESAVASGGITIALEMRHEIFF